MGAQNSASGSEARAKRAKTNAKRVVDRIVNEGNRTKRVTGVDVAKKFRRRETLTLYISQAREH